MKRRVFDRFGMTRTSMIWRPDFVSNLAVAFDGPRGRGFFKGGHNDSTANIWVCLEKGRRCVVLLSNDVRAEAAFPKLVDSILGETGLPWRWEYSYMPAPAQSR